MEFLEALFKTLGPLSIGYGAMIAITLRSLTTGQRLGREENKKRIMDNLETRALMVKYCGLPIEHFLQDLKESQVPLAALPDDDIFGQLLAKQLGGSK